MTPFYSRIYKSPRAFRFAIFIFLSSFFILFVTGLQASPPVKITDNQPSIAIGKYVDEYVDGDSVSSLETIQHRNFHPFEGGTPNYIPGVKSVWLKFKAINNSSSPSVYLNIASSNIGHITVFRKNNEGLSIIKEGGNELPLQRELFSSPDIILNLNLPVNIEGEYLIHVNSAHPISMPAYVSAYHALADYTIF